MGSPAPSHLQPRPTGTMKLLAEAAAEMTSRLRHSPGAPSAALYPELWEDPQNGSTLELHNLHHRGIRVHDLGFCFLDPLGIGGFPAGPDTVVMGSGRNVHIV